MRLLFITQVWDRNDSVLGFVPSWVEALGTVFSSITVIALKVTGEESASIPVHSLGKERGQNRMQKIFDLYTIVWRHRDSYDTVFVHMNSEYVILAGWLWKCMGKKIILWHAHGTVTWKLHCALPFVYRVLTSTPEGCPISSKKLRIVGQAIDTDLFKPERHHESTPSFVVAGRVSASKGQDLAVRALATLIPQFPGASLSIIGKAMRDDDVVYEQGVRSLSQELAVTESVLWVGSLSQTELSARLPRFTLCINMSTTGSLDKAGLEALSSGVPVVTANPAFKSILKDIYPALFLRSQDVGALVEAIKNYLKLSVEERNRICETLRNLVVTEHSIKTFPKRVASAIT